MDSSEFAVVCSYLFMEMKNGCWFAQGTIDNVWCLAVVPVHRGMILLSVCSGMSRIAFRLFPCLLCRVILFKDRNRCVITAYGSDIIGTKDHTFAHTMMSQSRASEVAS